MSLSCNGGWQWIGYVQTFRLYSVYSAMKPVKIGEVGSKVDIVRGKVRCHVMPCLQAALFLPCIQYLWLPLVRPGRDPFQGTPLRPSCNVKVPYIIYCIA